MLKKFHLGFYISEPTDPNIPNSLQHLYHSTILRNRASILSAADQKMGCCFSSKKLSSQGSDDKCGGAGGGGAPPRSHPPVEEETVKEVLSETPITKPVPPPPPKAVVNDKISRYEVPETQELKIEVLEIEPTITTPAAADVRVAKEELKTAVIRPAEDVVSEVSEYENSELCSVTESFSTTTTATVNGMEKRVDDGEEVTQRQRSPVRARRKRPNVGDMTGGRERGARSPARRALPSPESKKPVASLRQVQGRSTMGSQRRNVGTGAPNNGTLRRDSSTGGSARRSRSPATRGGQVGSRQNARYRSPGRSENGRSAGGWSPARALDNGVKVDRSSSDMVSPESSTLDLEKPNDSVLDETAESLENPLVSLECFIFL
ncbi:OLC1v1024067C1 [Oldenlandia corymbosa var. corymbosa]|uniref:OLC1v1024067C1 n=1 Tax=Oldenlandia corymbosa var. corymbosa TaxID=529605 RepID=A0AAV1C333_OLDCO|nr:OLC1v1024067C1 [Oldenlandia corymbosa var. corymbosa]